MSPPRPDPNLNALWARAVAEELCRGGARHAVIAPGSRSAPLALALAEQEEMRCWSVLDERSAGFFALGLAKGSREPTVVLATSGTAGAHFFPALIEAAQAGVPVIFITADRPPELHGFGALQTIPQQNLFGRFPLAAFNLSVPEASDSSLLHLRALTALATATAGDRPGGPVHLNFPFREPLAPTPLPFAADGLSPLALAGRAGRPLTRIAPIPSEPAWDALDRLGRKLERAERGLIVCGAREVWDGLPREIALLGQVAGYPILAEAASQLRFEADGRQTIAHYEAILRSPRFCSAHRPELILRFGGTLISKALQRYIDDSSDQGAEVITFSEGRTLFDPAHRSATVWTHAAPPICRRLNSRLASNPREDSAWAISFREADRRASLALERWSSDSPWPSEPGLARALVRAMPARSNLFVASSMPARDLDAFVPAGPELRVYSNRGVNGIDGLVSTALGVSAASQRPTAALLGDLALLHDLSGLLLAHRHRIPLTLVVPNNDGGGIFSFLPIAGFPDHFEELFATPQGIDLAHCATLSGARLHRPESPAALEAALRESFVGGLHLVEVVTRRDQNVIAHRQLYEAMVAAVEFDLSDRWELTLRGQGAPLLLLHGFGWTHRSFDDLLPDLGPGHQLILADLPGHGASAAPTEGFEANLSALAAELRRRGLTAVSVLGYSMGARLALGLALGSPALISRLALISGSPGLEPAEARAERRRADDELAKDLERLGVELFLDRWEAGPLFSGLRSLPAARRAVLRARRTSDADRMAAALRLLGLGSQPSYWERLAELRTPTLLVSGAEDSKFTALAQTMAARIAGAETVALAGCGHAPHLEAPERAAGPLRSFLSGSSQALR